MRRAAARVATDAAERYIKQLCNHANHMGARAEWSPPDGIVHFPWGGGTCHADAARDELVLQVESDTAEGLARIQTVLAADIARFGRRQNLSVSWTAIEG